MASVPESAQRYFTEWLPRQGGARVAGPATARIRVVVTGDGGGAWDLEAGPSGLTAGPQGTAPAQASLELSVEDFRELFLGTSLAPAGVERSDLCFLNPQVRSLIGAAPGVVQLEIDGVAGRTWRMRVVFGDGAGTEPTTVTLPREAFTRLLTRESVPPALMESGDLQFTGEPHLAMQLALGLVP
ncbi:MAG: hypothetical protein K1X89_09970 [Myxococcaceae bacterium]|nr:hypothetical protein [Myxococcaceae bacterium]